MSLHGVMIFEWHVMNENKILLPSFFRGYEFAATYKNTHSDTIFFEHLSVDDSTRLFQPDTATAHAATHVANLP